MIGIHYCCWIALFILLSSCNTESITPPENVPSAFATSENSLPSVQPTVESTPTPEVEPSQTTDNPDNPCPDFHLTPQNLELPVEKISNAPQRLNAMCSSPSTGDLYLLTDTEVFLFDIKSQQAQTIFEKSPDFKELIGCAVDNQENVYLADKSANQLLRYNNTEKIWAELDRNIEGSSALTISDYLSLQMSPQQEIFVLKPGGWSVLYFPQNLKVKPFDLLYKDITLEKFNRESYGKLFASQTLNTIKNTFITTPSTMAIGANQMFITTPSGWNEMFSIDLTSGEISSLPSVKQRGEAAFVAKSNIFLANSLFLTYSPRYKVLFQTLVFTDTPTWTSPETGCWQGLSTQIKPAGLAEGGDGHLYVIDRSTKTLNRIKLSPELFQPKTTD